MASEKVQRFVEALAPSAIEIGQRYGLDPALIISQSALETGWGDSVAGNNYFGVKSHGQPGGNTVLTHEEINGKMVPVYDSFRAYDGVTESMEDYAKFLRDNPRYKDVFNQSNVFDQIDAIAAAKYATDSNYANKLKAITRMFDLSPYQGGGQSNALGYNGLPVIGPTGGPALSAINKAAPVTPTPAVMRAPGKGNFWAPLTGPIRSGLAATGIQPTVMRAANRAMPSNIFQVPMPIRNAVMSQMMQQNIGSAPTVTQGHGGPGTRAYAVTSGGSAPVMLAGRSDGGSSGVNSHMNMAVYRANAATLGGGGFNQDNINKALSSGKTLYKLA